MYLHHWLSNIRIYTPCTHTNLHTHTHRNPFFCRAKRHTNRRTATDDENSTPSLHIKSIWRPGAPLPSPAAARQPARHLAQQTKRVPVHTQTFIQTSHIHWMPGAPGTQSHAPTLSLSQPCLWTHAITKHYIIQFFEIIRDRDDLIYS